MDGRKNDVFISMKPVGNCAVFLWSPGVRESEAAPERDCAPVVHLICGRGVSAWSGDSVNRLHVALGCYLWKEHSALGEKEDREIMELHRRRSLGYL